MDFHKHQMVVWVKEEREEMVVMENHHMNPKMKGE